MKPQSRGMALGRMLTHLSTHTTKRYRGGSRCQGLPLGPRCLKEQWRRDWHPSRRDSHVIHQEEQLLVSGR